MITVTETAGRKIAQFFSERSDVSRSIRVYFYEGG
jgi:hypothetical protein